MWWSNSSSVFFYKIEYIQSIITSSGVKKGCCSPVVQLNYLVFSPSWFSILFQLSTFLSVLWFHYLFYWVQTGELCLYESNNIYDIPLMITCVTTKIPSLSFLSIMSFSCLFQSSKLPCTRRITTDFASACRTNIHCAFCCDTLFLSCNLHPCLRGGMKVSHAWAKMLSHHFCSHRVYIVNFGGGFHGWSLHQTVMAGDLKWRAWASNPLRIS